MKSVCEPAGHALLAGELLHTTFWPSPRFTMEGVQDLEKIYKEALSGSMVTVMEISFDKSDYLVLGKSKEVGDFLWSIDAKDVHTFIPVIWKYGTLMPANMSPMEEFMFLAKTMKKDNEKYTKF